MIGMGNAHEENFVVEGTKVATATVVNCSLVKCVDGQPEANILKVCGLGRLRHPILKRSAASGLPK